MKFLLASGFTKLLNIEKVALKWEDMLAFCRENEEYIRATFETQDKVKFPDELTEENMSNTKVKIMKYFNPKLTETFGVFIAKKYSTATTYEINKVFKFA